MTRHDRTIVERFLALTLYLTPLLLLIPSQITRVVVIFPFGPNIAAFFIAVIQFLAITILVISSQKVKLCRRDLIASAVLIALAVIAYLRIFLFDFSEYLNFPNRYLFSGIAPYALALSTFFTLKQIKATKYDFIIVGGLTFCITILWSIEYALHRLDFLPPWVYSTPLKWWGRSTPDIFDSVLTTNVLLTSKLLTLSLCAICFVWLRKHIWSIILLIPFVAFIPAIIGTSEKENILMLITFSTGLILKTTYDLSRKSIKLWQKGEAKQLTVTILISIAAVVVTEFTLNKRAVDANYGAVIERTYSFPPGLNSPNANATFHSFFERIAQATRGYEVFKHNPLGYGPGIGQMMLFSGHISDELTQDLVSSPAFSYYASLHKSGFVIADFQQKPVQDIYSLHFWFFAIILDFGLFAIVLLAYLAYKIIRETVSAFFYGSADHFALILCIWALIAGVFFSPFMKANLAWLLVILYGAIFSVGSRPRIEDKHES